jgi:putative endonuclease
MPLSSMLLRATVDAVHQKDGLAKSIYMWYVYLLSCSDGTVYTGCTNNIDRRIKEHNTHKIHYTKDKTPVELLSYITCKNKYKAFEFEKYLKSGSGISFRNRHLI